MYFLTLAKKPVELFDQSIEVDIYKDSTDRHNQREKMRSSKFVLRQVLNEDILLVLKISIWNIGWILLSIPKCSWLYATNLKTNFECMTAVLKGFTDSFIYIKVSKLVLDICLLIYTGPSCFSVWRIWNYRIIFI